MSGRWTYYLGTCATCKRTCTALVMQGRLDREGDGHRAYVKVLDDRHATIDRCPAPRFVFTETTKEEYAKTVEMLIAQPFTSARLVEQEPRRETLQ